jgi:hypothetical protein
MQRHLAVAGLTCATGIVVGPTVYSFVEFLILSAFIGIVLGSLARAADARLGYSWGWLYGEPRHSTRLDLIVDSVLRRLMEIRIGHSSARGPALDSGGDESRIRIVPLDPERH